MRVNSFIHKMRLENVNVKHYKYDLDLQDIQNEFNGNNSSRCFPLSKGFRRDIRTFSDYTKNNELSLDGIIPEEAEY